MHACNGIERTALEAPPHADDRSRALWVERGVCAWTRSHDVRAHAQPLPAPHLVLLEDGQRCAFPRHVRRQHPALRLPGGPDRPPQEEPALGTQGQVGLRHGDNREWGRVQGHTDREWEWVQGSGDGSRGVGMGPEWANGRCGHAQAAMRWEGLSGTRVGTRVPSCRPCGVVTASAHTAAGREGGGGGVQEGTQANMGEYGWAVVCQPGWMDGSGEPHRCWGKTGWAVGTISRSALPGVPGQCEAEPRVAWGMGTGRCVCLTGARWETTLPHTGTPPSLGVQGLGFRVFEP